MTGKVDVIKLLPERGIEVKADDVLYAVQAGGTIKVTLTHPDKTMEVITYP